MKRKLVGGSKLKLRKATTVKKEDLKLGKETKKVLESFFCDKLKAQDEEHKADIKLLTEKVEKLELKYDIKEIKSN